jgi:thymidylate synthase
MYTNPVAHTATEAWTMLLAGVIHNGQKSSPRGLPIREITGSQVHVDMRYPIVLNAARKLSYKFMAAEAWWIISGKNDVASISKYCKNIANFSDNGHDFFGAYGPKIGSQIGEATRRLLVDPDTRQAVCNIWRENPPETKDVPCTLSVQWLVRDGKLHCIDTMRSNDVWLGFPYDVFNFTMLSWSVLQLLRQHGRKVELGTLTLNAGSHHVYERDIAKCQDWPISNWNQQLPFELEAGHSLEAIGDVRGQLAMVLGEPDLNDKSGLQGFFQEFSSKLLA